MALYQDGILISGANTLPKMTLADYKAMPAYQRPTYWERLDADYDDVLAEKSDIANVESGTTASRAYSVGELVYVSGTLYRVKTAIASGATFTVGTNVEVTNVSEEVYKKTEIKTKITSSATTSADGFVNVNLPNRTVIGAFCNGYICAIYRDGNGNNFVKVLDYNLAKVANTNVSNIVTLYL